MRKRWTLRIKARGSARPVGYSAGFDPRYWTRWGAARQAAKLNDDTSHHRNYEWVPTKARSKPW